MPEYPYLIIGGGMTAASAMKGIREADMIGGIGLIGREPHPPYKRPPLSKGLWKDEAQEKIWMRIPAAHVEMHLGRTAVSIDAQKKEVTDDKGIVYSYGKLLLATGGRVRTFSKEVAAEDIGIIYYRTFDDYQRLREETAKGKSFIVIGGGFIGSEVAAALAMNGKQVSMVYPEDAVGARIFPGSLAQFLNRYYAEKGVTLFPKDGVIKIEHSRDNYRVVTKSGSTIEADCVIAGLGIEPDTTLAATANIEVNNGIVVSKYLATNVPDIYAAGDVANVQNSLLGRRIRVEHEDNATRMGCIAGWNMAGKVAEYDYLPFFYSDLFDLGYEAVGDTDSRLETCVDWKEEFKEGVIYYLKDGRVRGVVLWNTWGQVDNARELIGDTNAYDEKSLKGRLPK